MIKVFHIITRLDMGGSAQNTLQTCLRLNGDRYRNLLAYGLSLESSMTEDEQLAVESDKRMAVKRGVTFYQIPSLVRRIHPWHDIRAFWALFRLLLKERPAIVHTHTSKAGILGRLAAVLARVPIVVHTPHGHVFYGHFRPGLATLFLGLEKLTARCTDMMIALTANESKDYLKYNVIGPGRLITIHSGVDIERFSGRPPDPLSKKKELGLAPDCRLVGTIGWLLPIKGPQYLLRAMAAVWKQGYRSELVFVGKGQMEKALRSEARALGMAEKVHFLGWRKDIPAILSLFDIFVLPSINEGMGRVLVEAMAAGKPVVASRAGGMPNLVRHGRNGLLVQAGNDIELADAIVELLSDPERARSMGRQGRRDCTDFSLDAMVAKLDRLYRNLLHRGAEPGLN